MSNLDANFMRLQTYNTMAQVDNLDANLYRGYFRLVDNLDADVGVPLSCYLQ